MAPSTTTGQPAQAIIWKPHEHADEYIVYIDDVKEYEQWKTDKSIALSRFVGIFSIFKSTTSGHTGQLGEVSKQEIETDFFADEKNVKDKSIEAAIVLILTNGKKHAGNLEHSNNVQLNVARGGHGDTRATGAARGSHR